MPEGPEIKLLGESLKWVIGLSLAKPPKLAMKIISIKTRGKVLYFIGKDKVLRFSFGLTGRLRGDKKTKHTRYTLNFTNGRKLYYDDMRNFGKLKILSMAQYKKDIAALGPDIFGLKKMVQLAPNKAIAVALMDQKRIAGIGNYLRSEILYCAKINPFVLVRNLTKKELNRIFKCILKISKYSYSEQKKGRDPIMKVYRQKFARRATDVLGRHIWFIP